MLNRGKLLRTTPLRRLPADLAFLHSDELRLATAHLLNTQALHLSPVEVLHLIQDDWPIGTLETFLSRFFRRQMHELQQGQIVKSISIAQNLEVQEHTWATLRSKGGWLQDVDIDGNSGGAAAGQEEEAEYDKEKLEKVPPAQAPEDAPREEKALDFNAPRR